MPDECRPEAGQPEAGRPETGAPKAGAPEAGGRTPADPRTNTVVKLVLRTGLSVALALLVAGMVVQLSTSRHLAADVKMFGVFAAPSVGESLMGLGVLALALTPVAGILSVLANWLTRERDQRFAGIAAIVLVVLAAAVLVGLAG